MKTDFRRSIFDGTVGQKENLTYNMQKLFLIIYPDPKPLIAGNFGLISSTSVQLNLMSRRWFGVFFPQRLLQLMHLYVSIFTLLTDC